MILKKLLHIKVVIQLYTDLKGISSKLIFRTCILNTCIKKNYVDGNKNISAVEEFTAVSTYTYMQYVTSIIL